MANVLPRDALKSLRRSYIERIVFVSSVVLIACGVVALAALISTYAVVTGDAESPSDGEEVMLSEASADRQAIQRAQSLVRELKPVATSTISIIELVRDVVAVRGERIRIESLDVRRGADGSISVSGTMSSRDDVNAYRAALSENPRFQKVSVPLGILTSASDTRFSISITGSF